MLVYLAAGDFLSDGRRKFDPAIPHDDDVLSNIRGVWDLGRHLEEWGAHPQDGPQVLIGIHGKSVRHRFVVGAMLIDSMRWGSQELEVPERHRWQVPLREPANLDTYSLRGRRVEGIRFGQFSWQLHIWVDGKGKSAAPRLVGASWGQDPCTGPRDRCG